MNKMYNEIFNSMSEGFAIHEIIMNEYEEPIDYIFLDVNPAFEKITGLKKEDIVGKRVLEILPRTEKHWIREYGEVAFSGKRKEFVNYSVEFDKYFKVSVFSSRKGSFSTLFFDVTDQVKKNNVLEKYKLFSENIRDIVLFIDMDGNILEVNKAAVLTYGYTREELLSMKIYNLRYMDDKSFVTQQMNKANSKGILFESYHIKKDGTKIPVQVNSIGTNIQGKRILLSVIRDISEQKQYKEKIIKLAYYDTLTDLPNRKLLYEELDKAILNAKKDNCMVSVMFFDIDKFKNINDTYGHNIGDLLLKQVGKRVQNVIRNTDVLARFGGDEFVLIQPNINSKNDIKKTVNRIIKTIKKPIKINKYELNITISIGICLYPEDGINTNELIKNADVAMYKVKNNGRNGYEFF